MRWYKLAGKGYLNYYPQQQQQYIQYYFTLWVLKNILRTQILSLSCEGRDMKKYIHRLVWIR